MAATTATFITKGQGSSLLSVLDTLISNGYFGVAAAASIPKGRGSSLLSALDASILIARHLLAGRDR